MAAIFMSERTFKLEVVPEVESYTKIGHAIPYAVPLMTFPRFFLHWVSLQ